MLDRCPGLFNIRTPVLTIKKCPQCGEEIEIFSNDVSVKCSRCGFLVFSDIVSCIRWCRYAKECAGEETYNRLLAGSKIPPPE